MSYNDWIKAFIMKIKQFIKKLRQAGVEIVEGRGKGGHVLAKL